MSIYGCDAFCKQTNRIWNAHGREIWKPKAWGTSYGCFNLQPHVIQTHVSSSGHKLSATKWMCDTEKKTMSIPIYISQLDDTNKNKVIITMKLMYFVAKKKIYCYVSRFVWFGYCIGGAAYA